MKVSPSATRPEITPRPQLPQCLVEILRCYKPENVLNDIPSLDTLSSDGIVQFFIRTNSSAADGALCAAPDYLGKWDQNCFKEIMRKDGSPESRKPIAYSKNWDQMSITSREKTGVKMRISCLADEPSLKFVEIYWVDIRKRKAAILAGQTKKQGKKGKRKLKEDAVDSSPPQKVLALSSEPPSPNPTTELQGTCFLTLP